MRVARAPQYGRNRAFPATALLVISLAPSDPFPSRLSSLSYQPSSSSSREPVTSLDVLISSPGSFGVPIKPHSPSKDHMLLHSAHIATPLCAMRTSRRTPLCEVRHLLPRFRIEFANVARPVNSHVVEEKPYPLPM